MDSIVRTMESMFLSRELGSPTRPKKKFTPFSSLDRERHIVNWKSKFTSEDKTRYERRQPRFWRRVVSSQWRKKQRKRCTPRIFIGKAGWRKRRAICTRMSGKFLPSLRHPALLLAYFSSKTLFVLEANRTDITFCWLAAFAWKFFTRQLQVLVIMTRAEILRACSSGFCQLLLLVETATRNSYLLTNSSNCIVHTIQPDGIIESPMLRQLCAKRSSLSHITRHC